MANNWPRAFVRYAIILGCLAGTLALAPAASARVRVGFDFNIVLPSHVRVSVGNYEPFYVGRVFYQPLAVWRPVYSFPVETPYGVVYEPYIYDGRHVVCRDYIPGREAGYGELIIEGRGHYDRRWVRGYRGRYHRDWDRGRDDRDRRHRDHDRGNRRHRHHDGDRDR